MATPPRLRERLQAIAPAAEIRCLSCRDNGVIWLAANDCPAGISAEELRERLIDGRVCLCTCEHGQWWLSWLVEMREMYGHSVPVRGVPDNLREVRLDAK